MRALCTAIPLAVLLVAAPCYAQNAADRAAAEMLFDEGRVLLGEGKFAEACAKLAESLKLDSGIGTMLYLAECYEQSGKTASAWTQFRDAEGAAARSNDPRAAVAAERAARLAPTLSRLTVVVPTESDVGDLVVTRDGTPVGRALWGTDAPVDPGTHVVRASATGRQGWETTVDVGPSGARARVVVPILREVAKAEAKEAHEPKPGSSAQRTIGLGLAALGVVGVGVGTYFGIRAIGTLSDADRFCDAKTCEQQGLDLREDSRSQALVSTVLFAVGGAALVGGAFLWLTAPSISVGPAGVSAAGRF